MQFVFKRDEEGRERIYVGDVCVAEGAIGATICTMGWEPLFWPVRVSLFHMPDILDTAIERADEAGFWTGHRDPFVLGFTNNEVSVDVPVVASSASETGWWPPSDKGFSIDGEDTQ